MLTLSPTYLSRRSTRQCYTDEPDTLRRFAITDVTRHGSLPFSSLLPLQGSTSSACRSVSDHFGTRMETGQSHVDRCINAFWPVFCPQTHSHVTAHPSKPVGRILLWRWCVLHAAPQQCSDRPDRQLQPQIWSMERFHERSMVPVGRQGVHHAPVAPLDVGRAATRVYSAKYIHSDGATTAGSPVPQFVCTLESSA